MKFKLVKLYIYFNKISPIKIKNTYLNDERMLLFTLSSLISENLLFVYVYTLLFDL